MKKTLVSIIILITMALLLPACNDGAKQNDNNENTAIEERENAGESKSPNKKEDNSEARAEEDENLNNQSNKSDDNALSKYSTDEIEFARVWLQIVGNQEIKELKIRHISAGEQVNPYDDDSVDYPEDVITLEGEMMADGIVTYSGNGDGTINLYNIPSHWPSHEQIDVSMEEYTEDIIKNTEQIYIETGKDEEVIELIKKLKIQS